MLKQNWLNKHKKYAFSGISKIHEYYKGVLPIKTIENELADISTYTRHKEGKRNTNFNPFFVYQPNEMWQIDIMYLPENSKQSKKHRYQLCVLDVFSRKLFIRTMEKKDTNTVTKCFDEIHNEISFTPKKIVADNGTEFTSEKFREYCIFFGINLIFTHNESKAAHVERAQRSFQNILYRMLEENQTTNFLPLLDDALYIYNNRKNRITGFSPNQAFDKKNISLVLQNLEKSYIKHFSKSKNPKFKQNDTVRIRELRGKFARGYHPYFSEEIFKIKKVLTNLPYTRYILTDFIDDEEIKGSFYEKEITLANQKTFKIEKIISKRKNRGKKQYFVKWLGYSQSQNSWVDATWIQKIKKANQHSQNYT